MLAVCMLLAPPQLRQAAPLRALSPRASAAASAIDDQLEILRQCTSSARPALPQATQALAIASNAGVHPENWTAALSGKQWKPVFSAKPGALKAAAADARGIPRPPAVAAASPGRFLNVDAQQTFSADGGMENSLRFLWGAVRFSFCGLYEMSGRRMTITFETLRIRLLFGLLQLSLDLRDGSRLRNFVERRVRGTTSEKKARPNVFNWCYADDGLCIAQGSSGSVAVWAATGTTADADDNADADADAGPPPFSGADRAVEKEGFSGGCAKTQLARRASYRSRPPTMVHSAEEVQTAAALIFPLLVYKAAAIAQRSQLMWYLDASIALATVSLLVYVAT